MDAVDLKQFTYQAWIIEAIEATDRLSMDQLAEILKDRIKAEKARVAAKGEPK